MFCRLANSVLTNAVRRGRTPHRASHLYHFRYSSIHHRLYAHCHTRRCLPSCSFINISFSRFLRLARLETYAQFEKVDIFISCIARVTRIKFSLRSLKLDIRFFGFVSFFTTNVFIFFTILIRQANLLLRERIIFDFFFCIKSFTILAILAPFATISCQTL